MNPDVERRLAAIYGQPPTRKRCSRCEQTLPVADFRANAKLRSGWDSWCRPCRAKANQIWRADHVEYVEQANFARRKRPQPRVCVECGASFLSVRRDRFLCGPTCKAARYRRSKKGEAVTTVPADKMQPAHQPPKVTSSSPATGKGQVNLGPPPIGSGPYPGLQITGLGPSTEAPPPPSGRPFTDGGKK